MTTRIFPQFHTHVNIRIWEKVFSRIHEMDLILADSKNTANDIHHVLNVPEKKIKVVYLGYNEQYKPLEDRDRPLFERKLLMCGIEKPYILCVGTLEPRKNIVRLIKAFLTFRKNSNFKHKLILVGGKGWLSDEIFDLLSHPICAENIKWLKFINFTDLPFIYNGADFFIYPSLYEGLGLPALEAMACGVPVIVSKTSSLPEIVGDAGLYLDPEDESSIEIGMYQMASNADLREDFKKKGLERAKLFSWDETASIVMNSYREILK